MSGDADPRHYTIIVGQFTLDRLSAREAVTVQQEDGGSVTLLDASDYPRGAPVSGDDRDAERPSHAQLDAEIARHMDEIDAANNRWRSAKAECAAVAAERDVAMARAGRLEAALRPFAEAGKAHKVSSTIVAPEQWRAAAAALADAPEGPDR